MLKKVCTICGKQFPATNEYFRKNKNVKCGLNSQCKECDKKYRAQNKLRPKTPGQKKSEYKRYIEGSNLKKDFRCKEIIKELPEVVTRQQLINWYLDKETKWGQSITTGELIKLVESCGKKIKGQSRLAIHISPEVEREFARKTRADLGQKKTHANVIIADSEREVVQKMYWEQGLSLGAIAERYNCSQTTVQKRMREWQLETRARGANIKTSTKTRLGA